LEFRRVLFRSHLLDEEVVYLVWSRRLPVRQVSDLCLEDTFYTFTTGFCLQLSRLQQVDHLSVVLHLLYRWAPHLSPKVLHLLVVDVFINLASFLVEVSVESFSVKLKEFVRSSKGNSVVSHHQLLGIDTFLLHKFIFESLDLVFVI